MRLKRDRDPDKVAFAAKRATILHRSLEFPNRSDSFRTLIEQPIEDALMGGFGAIEMGLAGNRERPFELWPVGRRNRSHRPEVGWAAGFGALLPGTFLVGVNSVFHCRTTN